jgi:hypothetical protein
MQAGVEQRMALTEAGYQYAKTEMMAGPATRGRFLILTYDWSGW